MSLQAESVTPTDLIHEIKAAFAGILRGNSIGWHEAEAVDSYGSQDEREAARRHDVEAGWEDVNPKLMDEFPSAVYFLDAGGFRFYLPAFMIADIEKAGHWKLTVDDGFLCYLADPANAEQLL